MVTNAIPDHLKSFINDHIDSVQTLEILISLGEESGRWWSARELAGKLYMQEESVRGRLTSLAAAGLVAVDESAEHFSYQPVDDRLVGLVQELSREYKVRRTAVITLIFTPL